MHSLLTRPICTPSLSSRFSSAILRARLSHPSFGFRRSTPLLSPTFRAFSLSRTRLQGRASDGEAHGVVAGTPSDPRSHITLEAPEPRLSMTFTCTVEGCHTRSTHQFTKRSYQKGIVLVQCPGCKNRHLIADHLGWFKESTEDGRLKTVEDLLRAKGENVRRGSIDADGVIEYVS